MCGLILISFSLLHADVWGSFLEDLLHSRVKVVHLALVLHQGHLEGLCRRDGDASLAEHSQNSRLIK